MRQKQSNEKVPSSTSMLWILWKIKEKQLLFQQKETMDKMLAAGALSKEQYEFSLNGLIEKMGFDKDVLSEEENYRSKL